MTSIYINDYAVMSRLGMNREETLLSLKSLEPPRPDTPFKLNDGTQTKLAALPSELPESAQGRTRTNRIASTLLEHLAPSIEQLKASVPAERIAVIVGTSTTGIEEALGTLKNRLTDGSWPEDRD